MSPPKAILHHRTVVSPFHVTAYDVDGEELSTPSLRWSSSDTSVLTVDPTGAVTPRRSGTAVIEVSTRTAVAKAPVTTALFASVVFPDSLVTLCVDDSLQLMGEIHDENGRPVRGAIQWESLDKTLAYVTSEGIARGLRPGRGSAVANVEGGVSARLPLRIIAASTRRGREDEY